MSGTDTASSAASTTSQLVVFSVSGASYALPISDVREIIRYTAPRSVGSPNGDDGVISLRGKVIPVSELAARLGLPAGGTEQPKILIVEHEEELAGVIVDDVEEVLTVDGSDFQQPPTAGDPLVDQIVQLDGRLIVTLRADEICGDGSRLRLVA